MRVRLSNMSEAKVIVYSATDLLLLGEAAKDVPLKEIAGALLKGLCHQESDVGLYECLFTNIINHFEPKEFEAKVSCSILPELVIFLEKIRNELNTNALSYFFVENLTTLLRLADVLQKFVDYLTLQTERCQLYHSLIIFPEYLLRCYTIVRKNYVTMANQTEALEAMKELYTVCKKILMTFLELLCPRDATSRGSYFRSMDSDEEYECLEKVCTLLAYVGNEISPIDSLLASDVWKAIVKLSTEHAEQSVSRNRTSWLRQIILILNSGVDTSFIELRTKNEASKQATIVLKLNAFFLRVMLKLLQLSKQHIYTEVFHPILGTLMQIKSCLRSNSVCNELAAGIEQYLHIGYMVIVESSFRSESFVKAICQHECKTTEEIHSFFVLLIYIVGQIVSNANDSHLISIYCYRQCLLTRVCTLLQRSDSLLFHNTALYKQLLTHCSVLILLGAQLKNRQAQKTIEETLVRMVLQEHYYTGLLGIDLWSVFVRYHSSQLLYGYFLFWKKINDQYSIVKTRPEQVFTAQVLRNLWVFLPSSQKVIILDSYPVSDQTNDRLWATIGLFGEMDATHRTHFAQSLEKRLETAINKLQHSPSVTVFYETLGLLLVNAKTMHLNGVLKERISRFWNSFFDWSVVRKLPASNTIFDCLDKYGERIPDNMLHLDDIHALVDASAFVKCVTVKLIERMGSSVNVSTCVEPLLKDHCPFIAALALNLLRKLNDKQHPAAQQLLLKCPHLQSQLSLQPDNNSARYFPVASATSGNKGAQLSVAHCCQAAQGPVGPASGGDLPQAINSEINELCPDGNGADIDDLDRAMFTGNVSERKKRKIDIIENHPTLPMVHQCLLKLDAQGKQLEKLVQSQKLGEAQKGQLETIISTLTKMLDS